MCLQDLQKPPCAVDVFVFDYSKALHVYLSNCAIQKTRVVVLGTGTRLDYILQGKRYGPWHH